MTAKMISVDDALTIFNTLIAGYGIDKLMPDFMGIVREHFENLEVPEEPHDDDLIRRRDALMIIDSQCWYHGNQYTGKDAFQDIRNNVPAAHPELDEWCDGCKEYDTEKHCCPRFNRVIRSALDDSTLIQKQDAIDIVNFECGEWRGLAKEIGKQIQEHRGIG